MEQIVPVFNTDKNAVVPADTDIQVFDYYWFTLEIDQKTGITRKR